MCAEALVDLEDQLICMTKALIKILMNCMALFCKKKKKNSAVSELRIVNYCVTCAVHGVRNQAVKASNIQIIGEIITMASLCPLTKCKTAMCI